MTRLAAIDIGTNSTKMTIADAESDGGLTVVTEDSQITRLGKGVDASKRLDETAMTRTLDVLVRFAEEARSLGATAILAAGTSALRDARNGPDFLAQAKDRAGLEIEIITGDREADLAYAAVASDPLLGLPIGTPRLVFDIGGGSTELILGEAGTVKQHKSLNVGAVRLTERFFQADPPSTDELASAQAFADQLLTTFPLSDFAQGSDAGLTIVGIGGTAVNLASMTRGLPEPDPDAVHGMTLSAEDAENVLHRLLSLPLAARRQLPGLEPERADVLPAGVLLLSRLLAYAHADRFTVSARGLRFGLLAEAAKKTR